MPRLSLPPLVLIVFFTPLSGSPVWSFAFLLFFTTLSGSGSTSDLYSLFPNLENHLLGNLFAAESQGSLLAKLSHMAAQPRERSPAPALQGGQAKEVLGSGSIASIQVIKINPCLGSWLISLDLFPSTTFFQRFTLLFIKSFHCVGSWRHIKVPELNTHIFCIWWSVWKLKYSMNLALLLSWSYGLGEIHLYQVDPNLFLRRCSFDLVSRLLLLWASSLVYFDDWAKGAHSEVVRNSLFGLNHRRRVRAPLLSIPRFNKGDNHNPSSVKANWNLQLGSYQPQVHTPERLPGEPPAGHQLASTKSEAFEDCSCGSASGFSPDPPSVLLLQSSSTSVCSNFSSAPFISGLMLIQAADQFGTSFAGAYPNLLAMEYVGISEFIGDSLKRSVTGGTARIDLVRMLSPAPASVGSIQEQRLRGTIKLSGVFAMTRAPGLECNLYFTLVLSASLSCISSVEFLYSTALKPYGMPYGTAYVTLSI